VVTGSIAPSPVENPVNRSSAHQPFNALLEIPLNKSSEPQPFRPGD
jgi:hypothetical protein